jgi:cellulose synthase/poly-beta-1,6-N-acetylglucosamine synthase-like glycosyltransferase
MGILLVTIYALSLSFILMYSLAQVHLAVVYLRNRKKPIPVVPQPTRDTDWPMVTVQLPIYNERYVIERLIEAVAKFDYPADRFEIQVLDDSTDDTVEIVQAKIAALKATCPVAIHHIRRPERKGFKAGALHYGLQLAKGEFIAIFDADFVPTPDFLRRTVVHFHNPEIGVVQTRWSHLNADYSLLTKLQAFTLDAHFSVEQAGRNAAGYFINFNGTAGIWRRKAIEDAGGWQSDTLTEDLDLSYRAQLKGWRFFFLEELQSPAELPAVMSAIKSQQFRWTKGAAETAKKNLGKVMRSSLPLSLKVHAAFHLLNSFLFICIITSAVISVPLVFLQDSDPLVARFFKAASLFLIGLLSLIVFFWVSRRARDEGSALKLLPRFILTFPAFLAVSMGFSLHNAIATVEGYLGIKSPFIRTPKHNLTNLKENWRTRGAYLSKTITPVAVIEMLLSLYFWAAVIGSVWTQQYGMIPYHMLLATGFSTISYFTLRHAMVRS